MKDSQTIKPGSQKPVPKGVVETALENWRESGKRSTISVTGESMLPFLHPGDSLEIVHGRENIRPGALIAYRQDGILVVHRALRSFEQNKQRYMLLKGDNCTHPDPPVLVNQVIGHVSRLLRGSRHYNLDIPGWQVVGAVMAAFTNIHLSLEGAARKALLNRVPNKVLTRLAGMNRLLGRLFSLPGRCLNWLGWKLSNSQEDEKQV